MKRKQTLVTLQYGINSRVSMTCRHRAPLEARGCGLQGHLRLWLCVHSSTATEPRAYCVPGHEPDTGFTTAYDAIPAREGRCPLDTDLEPCGLPHC